MDSVDPVPAFLDVPSLLENSEPRPRAAWFWYALGLLLLLTMGNTYAESRFPQVQGLIQAMTWLGMAGLLSMVAGLSWLTVRKQKMQQKQFEAVEELVQLRRWPQAVMMLQALLARPAYQPQLRVQALLYLASVLARYHRFEDVIAVHDYLLENIPLDDSAIHAIRLGRAMAMLREDHLFDADRAISELRHSPGADESAGLALVEIYRDVKTGHPHDAIHTFNQRLPLLRAQLGQRLADAYVLLAKACDLLAREEDARSAYEKATCLCPALELHRRYPEVASLGQKCRPAPAPSEVA